MPGALDAQCFGAGVQRPAHDARRRDPASLSPARCRGGAHQLRQRWPKLAALMHDSEHDVLAYMAFPTQHRTKLHSTNPLERLNKKVKRRADVVGIFPNEASITRLIGAVLLQQNDEWLL
jgi:transposase-like protein